MSTLFSLSGDGTSIKFLIMPIMILFIITLISLIVIEIIFFLALLKILSIMFKKISRLCFHYKKHKIGSFFKKHAKKCDLIISFIPKKCTTT